jgi:hypothetical protein
MIVVGLLVVLNTAQLGTPEEYAPEDLPQLASDFQLQYELRDHAGQPVTDSVVDDITLVRVIAPESVTGLHDLVYYLDGRFVGARALLSFPYDFRFNFKGLREGSHAIVLVFTNAEGDKGIVRLNLTVQHP